MVPKKTHSKFQDLEIDLADIQKFFFFFQEKKQSRAVKKSEGTFVI